MTLQKIWKEYLDAAEKACPLIEKQCGNCAHFERGHCNKHTIEVSYCFAGCHDFKEAQK